MKKIDLIFIEPNSIMRQGLSIYLNSLEMISSIIPLKSIKELEIRNYDYIDLIIMDTECNDDFKHILKFRKTNPILPILIFTTKERFFDNFLFAQKYNLPHFLTQRINPDDLVEEITVIQKETEYGIPPYGQPNKTTFNTLFDSPPIFTLKELCILQLVARAKTNSEIGSTMGLSHRTIETHRRKIIEKIEGKNIIPALVVAIQENYISIDSKKK